MSGLAGLAWRVYQNSGPFLQFVVIVMMATAYKLVWKGHVKPRLADLEDTQEAHRDRLDEKAISAGERDVLLENAHDRLDQADEARQSLRQRLTRLEQRYAMDHGGNADDMTYGPPEGAPAGGGDD